MFSIVYLWDLCTYSGFSPQSKQMPVRLTGDFKMDLNCCWPFYHRLICLACNCVQTHNLLSRPASLLIHPLCTFTSAMHAGSPLIKLGGHPSFWSHPVHTVLSLTLSFQTICVCALMKDKSVYLNVWSLYLGEVSSYVVVVCCSDRFFILRNKLQTLQDFGLRPAEVWATNIQHTDTSTYLSWQLYT